MFIKVLSYLFILLIISHQSFASSENTAIEEEASVVEEKKETASDVFVNFITDNIEDVDEKDMNYINNDWVDDLEKDVQKWSASEAKNIFKFFTKLKSFNRSHFKAASKHCLSKNT